MLIGLAVGGGAGASRATAGPPAFGSALTLASYDDLHGGIPADIDRDGDLDLVITSDPSDEVAWFENDGTTSFWAKHLVGSSFDGRDVAVGDVDGDGWLDVVGAAHAGGGIAWFRNPGTGSVWSTNVIATASATWLAVGDVDRDGDPDVLAGGSGTWYANPGGAGSWTATALPGASAIRRAVITDLDGDGWPDVVAAGGNGGNSVVWWSNAGGTLTKNVIGYAVDTARSVDVGDVDGDGAPDIVLAAAGTSHEIVWLEHVGPTATDWMAHTIDSAVDGAQWVSLADLDGDGDLDVVGDDTSSLELSWWEQDAGTWTEHPVLTDVANTVVRALVADMDGDGDLDLLIEEVAPDRVRWVPNLSVHGSALPAANHAVTSSLTDPLGLASADLDGDGDLDLVTSTLGQLSWYESDSGTWTQHDMHSTVAATGVAIADLDRDGDLDVVASDGNEALFWEENSDACRPSFCAHELALLTALADLALADLDGDGDPDLVATSRDSGIFWFENDGASSWTTRVVHSPRNNVHTLQVGDLDGDGDLDLVTGSDGGSGPFEWWENDLATGTACGSDWCSHPLDAVATTGVALGDLDGDGDLDLLQAEAGGLSWWSNDAGDGSAWSQHGIISISARYGLAAVDLDGDGDLDVTGLQDGAWMENSVGDGSGWTLFFYAPGEDVVNGVVADLDGDGDLDLIESDSTDGTLGWWENHGGQVALTTIDAVTSAAPNEGNEVALLEITGAHRGRDGDDPAELSTLQLRFEQAAGDPLTEDELDALASALRLYLDDGDGVFEPDTDDTPFYTVSPPYGVVGGTLTLPQVDGDPNVRLEVGASRTWWLSAELPMASGSAVPDTLLATHETSQSTVRMTSFDAPLTLENAMDVGASQIAINGTPALLSPIADRSAETGVDFTLDVGPSFDDDSPLTFTATGLPSGLEITAGGVVSGQPALASASGSPYTVTVTATDGGGLSAADSFELTVGEVTGTIVVDGTCTLTDAIWSAISNADEGQCSGAGGVETIVLDAAAVFVGADPSSTLLAGSYAALPDVTSEMTIQAGSATVIERFALLDCSSQQFRLFNVRTALPLVLDGVTLRNGCAANGGAVALDIDAALVALDSTFVGNQADGAAGDPAYGGAIYVQTGGSLTVDGSVFQGNQAVSADSPGVATQACGGAIYIAAATGTISGSTFASNAAHGGASLDTAGQGGTATGGAIRSDGSLASIATSSFVGNQAVGGAAAGDGVGGTAAGGALDLAAGSAPVVLSGLVFGDDHAIGGASASGQGGPATGGAVLLQDGAEAQLDTVRIDGSSAEAGAGDSGGAAAGGGLIAKAGASISGQRLTVDGNSAMGGDGASGPGGDAYGGGVSIDGDGTWEHWTVSGNVAVGGASTSGTGGSALGGGLARFYGTSATLRLSTVAANAATSGAGGAGPGIARGGGVLVDDTPLDLAGSLLADNSEAIAGQPSAASDCEGSLVSSSGFNLLEAPGTCTTGGLDLVGIDPELAPLGDYGCATFLPDGSCLPTHGLPMTSAAIDHGGCTASGATADERGRSRPWDAPAVANSSDGCDVGAYEARDEDGNGIEDGIEGLLFSDGFESGDTSRWSSSG